MPDLPPPGSTARVTDPQALRALSHPLRLKLLGLLRLEGPATASRLGRTVGESSGATSYHLRELARYGFVTEVEGRGTARERWWEAVHRSTSWSSSDFSGADVEVVREMEHRLLEHRARTAAAWLEQRDALPAEWRGAASLSDLPLHLTPEQAGELAEELHAVLARWRDERQASPGTPGTEVVQVYVDLVPLAELPL